jgi:hypothetical protein
MREPYYLTENLDLKLKTKPLTVGALKDLSLIGSYYSNSISADDLSNPTYLVNESDFSFVPLMTMLFTADESYEV